MKKILITILLLPFFVNAFSQEHFCGNLKCDLTMAYEDNMDIVIETVKSTVDTMKKVDALTKAIVKAAVKGNVKRQFKFQDQMKYINSYPTGTYSLYWKLDGQNNRQSTFCPELGRILIQDANEGVITVVYPKIKMALKLVDPIYKNEYFKTITKKTGRHSTDPLVVIDGMDCISNYALFEYEKIGGELIDTVTIDKVLYVKIPMNGYKFAEYNSLDKYVDTSNEYLTQNMNVTAMTVTGLDEDNFEFPSDYTVFTSIKPFLKKFFKIKKKQDISIPYNGDFPENFWDIIK